MKTVRSTRPRTPAAQAAHAAEHERGMPAIEAAVVEALGDNGRLTVRRSRDGRARTLCEARLARIVGYAPSIGDRVLVSFGTDEHYVIAVLHAAAPEVLCLPDGARAELALGRLELRDAAGRLLVRYADGNAEIAAPAGDLRLSAPQGQVTIESALDVALSAGRDVRIDVARRFQVEAEAGANGTSLTLDPKRAALQSPEVDVTAKSARLATGRAMLVARSIATTAEHLAQTVTKYELVAERLVERTKDTFRDASDLVQLRAGRLRTLVKDVWSVNARRSLLVSTEETAIDGDKVLLG